MWAFYIPSMVAVSVAVLVLLRRYAAPSMPYIPQIVTAVAWITSIGIVALVPIDVWSTLNKTSRDSVAVMWSIAYWATQVLTWFTIPVMQGYYDAGDFTFWKRFVASLRSNLTYYLSIGGVVLVGILILLVSGRLTPADLIPLGMTLSNTYGLIAVLLLLGYGLVRIPRSFWQESDPEACLRLWLHRLGKCADRLRAARVEMHVVATVVEATAAPMSARDPLRPLMDIIYKQAEEHSPIRPTQAARDDRGRVNMDDLTDTELDYGCDEHGLASLRARLTHAINSYNGKLARYATAVRTATELEVIVKCRAAGLLVLHEAGGVPPGSSFGARLQQAGMVYKCTAEPWVFKLLALALAAFSALIVWSEATIGFGRDLSPFSHAVQDRSHAEVLTQLAVGVPLSYMCGAAYYSLFKLGIFSFYHMVPHATDPHSLLMNAGQVSRFAAPLAFNFLHVVRMQEGLRNKEKLVFAQKMGKAMSDVPIFSSQFNTWFPLTLVIWVLNVGDTLARVFLPRKWRSDHDALTDESAERGRTLLRQEQEAQKQGLPMGTGLSSEGTGRGQGGSFASSALNKGAAGASTALTPASSHPSNRSRTHSADTDPELGVGAGGAQAGFLGRWRLPSSTSTPAMPATAGDRAAGLAPSAPSSASPPPSRGANVPATVSPLTRGLLRNKHGSTESMSSAASASAHPAGPTSSLDGIFARMQSSSDRGGGRIDDDEEDDGRGGLLSNAWGQRGRR